MCVILMLFFIPAFGASHMMMMMIVTFVVFSPVRRLCPDIMFFQRGTEFPCRLVVDDPEVERLHRRVTHTSLAATAVTRKGLGIKKVRTGYEYCSELITLF